METETQGRRPLSAIADDVWAYILGYYTDHKYMPTLTEISLNFEKKSKSWASNCLEELERQGKIKIDRYKHRGIELITKK